LYQGGGGDYKGGQASQKTVAFSGGLGVKIT